MEMSSSNLTSQFLIAMPDLEDANFHHTVTYICEHTEQGAMGIVLNRPTDIRLNDILGQLDIDSSTHPQGEQTIYVGGPVQTDRGFVLHSAEKTWSSTLRVTERICVTTSIDILEAIAHGQGPAKTMIALGYAGWGGGQLEEELIGNSWLSSPADDRIIFDLDPDQRWKAAARLMGVDLDLLSSSPGHA
ncbi:MAG: YqgE/AlgH family protein [Candidatus Sedimenticola endophacoides]|uniref:UPF0301 protein C3L24_08500 n=1 Tax=Candidatus Sedimenticola endophacoides TaxID=2548426 RepID=A0A6N4DLS5_9GAMM|nr:MAG: YqgE/AlgH family protein [Candidatus Sedimenticola endophacoides]PUE01040.1 MAG: YqgE/AlgH family protein [Candidatus Sedimenticola endophacoides]PUE03614.1 MAG: YqgE/AlgH family protein [Candidatus Sedimenticola endophacoides]